MLNHLVQILVISDKADIAKNKESIICSLMVLPHLTNEGSSFKSQIKDSIHILIHNIFDEYLREEENVSSGLLMLSQALSSLYLMSDTNHLDLNVSNEIIDLLLPLVKSHVLSLQVLDLYVNTSDKSCFEQKLVEIKSVMTENLASPFHLVNMNMPY